MRVLFFSSMVVGIVAVYETLAPLFFGFYVLGACVYFFTMMRWDFSMPYVRLVGAYVTSVAVQWCAAFLFIGHIVAWRYSVHIVLYEILIGICIYEITKKENT
jgi:hypothetical protein